ncbi:MAG: hypothetical protein P4L65_10180 [Legionella sp.]|nr:hypothetical protein [Legionella sp.]
MALSFKKISTLALLLGSGSVMAGTMGAAHVPSQTNFFVGLGGGYNSIQTKQNVYAIGVASYTGSISGSGTAQGPAYPFYNTENTFAPEVQAGFFRQIMDTNYLWGVKFSYQYLGAVATHSTFTVSQSGTVNGTVLNGNVLVESAQNKTTHEMLLLPFIGQSFKHSQIYLGVGPALFGTGSNINGEIGFANLFSSPTDLTGAPANSNKKSWEWGGAAQVGLSYFLASDWTVDLSYTYAISNQYKINYAIPFTHFVKSDNITTTGTGYTNTSQNVMAQAVTLTVNKVFSM